MLIWIEEKNTRPTKKIWRFYLYRFKTYDQIIVENSGRNMTFFSKRQNWPFSWFSNDKTSEDMHMILVVLLYSKLFNWYKLKWKQSYPNIETWYQFENADFYKKWVCPKSVKMSKTFLILISKPIKIFTWNKLHCSQFFKNFKYKAIFQV